MPLHKQVYIPLFFHNSLFKNIDTWIIPVYTYIAMLITYIVRTTRCILQFYIWLLFNSIKIFMQTIQEKCKQFLWIMLLVSQKLWGKSAHLKLQKYIHIWHNMKQSAVLSVITPCSNCALRTTNCRYKLFFLFPPPPMPPFALLGLCGSLPPPPGLWL